ncbi:Hypothetical protein FKW44_002996 [Caligus rogercresseyi]|uniref:Uncharacterized protein n=1 Tax=Caligus rogercresseyi TaxID=217165 RepID=A0A7T8QWR4_CALRO|nr:Hypothetical protein FKW44_002996 [Caligus rogercresseyi]
MSSELERRTAIIVALRCGRAPKEIIKFFKFPKATVYSIAKSFKESKDIEEGFLTPKERLQTDPKSGRGAPPHFFAKGQNVNGEALDDPDCCW